MSSKNKSTTSQREYFRAMLRRNESARNGRPGHSMEAIMVAWYEGAIWPRVADPYGLYAGSEQFYEAVPLMRAIPHDGDTYRVYLASLAPERYVYEGSADRINKMWADLEAEATAGRVRPLKLTRYLADVRESGTLRPVPARILRSEDGAEIWISAERLSLVHVDLDALMSGYRFEQATDKDAGRGAVRVIERTRYGERGADPVVAWIMPLDRGSQAMEQQ